MQTQTAYRDAGESSSGKRRIVVRQYNGAGLLHRESSPFLEESAGAGGGFFNPNWATVPNYRRLLYDARGEVQYDRTMSQSSVLHEVEYVTDGRQVTVLDLGNRRTRRLNDMLGNLLKVEEMASASTVDATTTYDDDALDRLIVVRDAQDQAGAADDVRIVYDRASNKRQLHDPLSSGTWTYTYDPAGNLVTSTDARGETVWHKYDDIGRLTEKRDGGSSGTLLAKWVWDHVSVPAGALYTSQQRTPHDSWVIVTNAGYDERGRVTERVWSLPGSRVFATGYTYRANGAVATMRYPADASGALGETLSFRMRPVRLSPRRCRRRWVSTM